MTNIDIEASGGFDVDGMKISWRAVMGNDSEWLFPIPEMIRDTITRFKVARHMLAAGINVEDAPEYPAPVDAAVSSSYRVQIFADMPVMLGELGTFKCKGFVFTECTYPENFVHLMRIGMRGLWLAGYLDRTTNGNDLASTAQEFADHAENNGGQVNLAEQFPRNTDGGASSQKTEPSTNGNDESPIIMNFDNRKDEFAKYCEVYQGKKVKVRIAKIGNSFKTNQAKSKTWQVFEFTPFYNNEPGKYVAFNLDQYVPPAGDKAWKYNDGGLLKLQELVPEAGNSVEGDYFVTFLVNPSTSRVYWNATNVELVADSDYTEAALNEAAAGEEIPF